MRVLQFRRRRYFESRITNVMPHAILYTSIYIFYAVCYKRKLTGDFYSFPINFEISFSSKSPRCDANFQSGGPHFCHTYLRGFFVKNSFRGENSRFSSWKQNIKRNHHRSNAKKVGRKVVPNIRQCLKSKCKVGIHSGKCTCTYSSRMESGRRVRLNHARARMRLLIRYIDAPNPKRIGRVMSYISNIPDVRKPRGSVGDFHRT